MRVGPQEVLFIGDTFALDVVGAKSAAWMRPGSIARKLPRSGQGAPDYTITRLIDLLEIL